MFGLGFWELVVIAVVALLFVGPDKMPKFFRALGRATREFQRASRELRENLSLDEPPPSPKPPVRRPPTDVAVQPGGVSRAQGRTVELPPDAGSGLDRSPGGAAAAGAPEPAGVKPPAAAQSWPTAEDAERRARDAAAPPIVPPVKVTPTSAPAVQAPTPSEPRASARGGGTGKGA